MSPSNAAVYTFFFGLAIVAACATATDPDFETGETGEGGDGGAGGLVMNGPSGTSNGGSDAQATSSSSGGGTTTSTASSTTASSVSSPSSSIASSSAIPMISSSSGLPGGCMGAAECPNAGECCLDLFMMGTGFCSQDLMIPGTCLP